MDLFKQDCFLLNIYFPVAFCHLLILRLLLRIDFRPSLYLYDPRIALSLFFFSKDDSCLLSLAITGSTILSRLSS